MTRYSFIRRVKLAECSKNISAGNQPCGEVRIFMDKKKKKIIVKKRRESFHCRVSHLYYKTRMPLNVKAKQQNDEIQHLSILFPSLKLYLFDVDIYQYLNRVEYKIWNMVLAGGKSILPLGSGGSGSRW